MLGGVDHWFTFLGERDAEATNNRAERALRELVVQRKIWGCLRNIRGAAICETVMSLFYTWRMEGRDRSSPTRSTHKRMEQELNTYSFINMLTC